MQSVTLRQNGIRRWVSAVLVCCLFALNINLDMLYAAEILVDPRTIRPDRPYYYCWWDPLDDPYLDPQPHTPPAPFLYQPFDMNWSGDIWSGVMDHNDPNYKKNNTVSTLGENVSLAPVHYGKFTYYWSPALETLLGYDGHDGHDFKTGGRTGIAALAAADGAVVYVNSTDNGALGKYVDIYHSQGYLTRYAHLADVYVEKTAPYSWVSAGTEIGEIGTTGNSTGIHLHFSVYRWNTDRNGWQITDPFGWDPWRSPDEQIEDPLYNCNGEVSYNLWVGGMPQRVDGSASAYTFPNGAGIGGWLEVEDYNPPTFLDQATFIRDVTLPDYTVVSPGVSLVKTWRVRNSGTSTWDGYRLIFRSGNQMGAPASVNIPYTPPGHEVDISVPIVAPQASARGDWHIVNTSGTLVRNGGMWVILTVQGTEPVVTSDIDLECINSTCYATVTPGQTFRPTIRVTVNTGQLLESRGDMLRHKAGDLFGAWPHVAVQGVVNAGQSYDFTFYADNPIHAPMQEGTYESKWQVWRNGNWAGQEFTLRFTVSQSGSNNRAPNRPTLTGPSDWAVYQGNTGITLSAQHNGDPDGDAVTHYYFDIFESAQLANSGWIASNSWSPQGLGYFGYQWRVKVRDSHGAESGWSDVRHFTVYNPQITITQLDFVPLSNGEQVRIMACASGAANTLKVQVNTANDGSDNGEWRTLKELGVPCFNENDAPIWTILNYASGPHRVRVLARGDGGWENAAVLEKTYTVAANLRPNSPSGILPSDQSYLNSRIVNFQWTETFRTTGYQLQASESTTFDTLLLDQTFPAGLTQHTQIFSADYATVYWRVTAVGPYGTHESNRRFHIDLDAPTSSMTALSPVTTDTKFNVNWTSTDARSGVRWYHVQMRDVSRPDSAWEDWLVNTTKQAELFQGQPGHTYAFRVRAMDNIGNWEAWPDDEYGHTHTLVDPASAPPTAWWDANYAHKRNLVILNNDSNTMPADFPIHIRFDATTTPSAAEIYNASLAATKGDDVRVVYDNQTEVHRFVQRFTPDQIHLWFPLQAALGSGQTNSGDYQLYYGHAGGSSPPSDTNAVFLPKADTNTVLLAHFQEASGSTVADTSGRSHHGSFSNAGWADGFLGYAGSFNGTNSEVNFSNHVDFNLTAMTLEAWVWIPTDAPGDRHIFNKDTYWVRLTGSYWPYSKIFGIESGDGCPSVQPNTWAHIAVAYNGTDRVRTYVNGQRCNEKVVSGFSPSHTAAAFRVGNAYNWPGRHFLGRIQHVRVSNIERTSFPYARITTPPSVEAGLPIAPSVPGAPDLAILDLTTYPNPDGGLLVVAQVENQGDADTQSNFYTDLYVNHLPTGAGDYTGSLQFWVNMPIEAGAQITLTTIITDLAGMGGYMMHALSAPGAEVTATLYAQVDSVGVISETDTTNNISPGVEICLASSDAYASDDDISGAAWLHLGEVQQRNFDRPTDRDWVKFTAHGGVTYTLRTFDLGNAADTYLYLYDTDGATLLAANDDYGGSLASRIDWMAPVTGTYYALVQHWNPNVGGCGTSYSLSLSTMTVQKTFNVYLPLVTREYSAPTPTQTLTIHSQIGDGEIGKAQCSTWAECRGATTGNLIFTTFENATVGVNYENDEYTVKRVFFYFDTSALPISALIQSVTLHFYAGAYQFGSDRRIHVVQSTQASPLSSSDFDRVGFASGGFVNPLPNTWSQISLNATGRAWIVKGGLTRLALMHNMDLENTIPTERNDVLVAMAESSTGQPYLTIEYTVP